MTTRVKNPYKRTKVNLKGVEVPPVFKDWCVQECFAGKKTPKKIAIFYNLNRVTVAGWVHRVKIGFKLNAKGGRPKTFTEEALQKVMEKLDTADFDIRRDDYNILLQEAAIQSAQQQGRSTAVAGASRSTMLRASKAMGVETGHAEATTEARILACGEIRNQVSMAAMVMSKANTNQLLTLNFDSTAFTVGGRGADDVEVKYTPAANKLDVGKSPGSTTSINQPCDVKNCFRGPKTQNKKISNKDVKDNTFMLAALTRMFAEHNAWLNSEERGAARANGKLKKRLSKKDKPGTIVMDPAHVGMAKYGLLRVQLALQMCMRPHMIRESFQCTGIYPVDTNKILSNCHRRLTPGDLRTITEKMPELVELMRTQGEIFESDFDRLGILSTSDRQGKGLDDLVIYRRRALLLTHPSVRQREDAYRAQKVAAEEKSAKKRKAATTFDKEVNGKRIKLFFN